MVTINGLWIADNYDIVRVITEQKSSDASGDDHE